MRTYLAGAMRNRPYFNYEQFQFWAKKLRAEGHEVWSPEEHSRVLYGDDIYLNNPEGDEEKAGIDGKLVFSDDISTIIDWAEAIAMMPGWRKSKGARAEHAVAVAIGLRIIYLDNDAEESFVASVAAVVGDKPEEHVLMLGVGDGTSQRWKLTDSLLRKLRSEINPRVDR